MYLGITNKFIFVDTNSTCPPSNGKILH